MKKNSLKKALYIRALCGVIIKLSTHEIEQELKKEGIKVSLLSFLVLRLIKYKPQTIKELSKQLWVAPATLVPLIDVLEKKGLVKRCRDDLDRRKNPIFLTSKGIALARKVALLSAQSKLIKIIDKVGDKKSRQFIALLEEIVRNLAADEKICANIFENIQREVGNEGCNE